jgi:hypothetical protein
MSTAEHVTLPADPVSAPPANPDPDFAHRWTAWQARGIAHDHVVRQRAILVAIGSALIAAALAFAYVLMAS